MNRAKLLSKMYDIQRVFALAKQPAPTFTRMTPYAIRLLHRKLFR